ncbi:MAG: PEP-CTERM sorting domain-containing protein [Hyphomicrobiales bacterium]|nr:PEP-CTERM sorting domain-containing protein [Hyphomicrobiales bacterium]
MRLSILPARFTAVAAALAAGAVLALPAGATPLTTYSSVGINSNLSVLDGTDNDKATSTDGSALELDVSGSQNFAYGNGSGGYTVKPTTNETFARSSLQSGELKTRASLGFGTDVSGIDIPVGTGNGASSAMSVFGDSFRAYSGDTPFLWTDGTTAQFSFGITGTTTVPDNLAVPNGYGAGEPKNQVYTSLVLKVFQPGGLDIWNQLANFDFNAYSDFATGYAIFQALSAQLTGMTIANEYWYFGDLVVPYPVDAAHVLPVSADTPTEVTAQFTPDGDFDWLLTLDSTVFLDSSLENVTATMDFSSTVTTSYQGPDGAVTYSASGLFPGTLALSTAPAQVPEPGSAVLFGVGVIGLVATRRRRVRGGAKATDH